MGRLMWFGSLLMFALLPDTLFVTQNYCLNETLTTLFGPEQGDGFHV